MNSRQQQRKVRLRGLSTKHHTLPPREPAQAGLVVVLPAALAAWLAGVAN